MHTWQGALIRCAAVVIIILALALTAYGMTRPGKPVDKDGCSLGREGVEKVVYKIEQDDDYKDVKVPVFLVCNNGELVDLR